MSGSRNSKTPQKQKIPGKNLFMPHNWNLNLGIQNVNLFIKIVFDLLEQISDNSNFEVETIHIGEDSFILMVGSYNDSKSLSRLELTIEVQNKDIHQPKIIRHPEDPEIVSILFYPYIPEINIKFEQYIKTPENLLLLNTDYFNGFLVQRKSPQLLDCRPVTTSTDNIYLPLITGNFFKEQADAKNTNPSTPAQTNLAPNSSNDLDSDSDSSDDLTFKCNVM